MKRLEVLREYGFDRSVLPAGRGHTVGDLRASASVVCDHAARLPVPFAAVRNDVDDGRKLAYDRRHDADVCCELAAVQREHAANAREDAASPDETPP